MTWLKNNSIKLIMALINTFLLTSLMLSSYDVRGGDLRGYAVTLLSAVIPVLLISTGAAGLFSEKKPLYLLLIAAGAAALFMTFRFSPELLGREITAINTKLGNSEELFFSDFKLLIQSLGVFLTLISVLSIYIYPWNILITDLALIFFLWAVDYLTKAGTKLLPFIFLWAVLLAHERALSRDISFSRYKEKNIDTRGRFIQTAAIGLIIGFITVNVLGFSKGIYYDNIWVKANDFLMQDEFMAGNRFLNAFSLKNSGYNDSSSKLGGDIKLDSNVMLTVEGDAPGYLRGNTKYQYTGNLWLKNNFIYRTENSASSDVTKKYRGAALRTMRIVPQGIRTSSIFVPSYPGTVVIEDRRPDLKLFYSIKDQTFVLDEVTEIPYEVKYYDENDVRRQAGASQNSDYSDETDQFLEIPESVTERTVDLVTEITAGLNTQHEKMEAIKSYLSENYTYTLTPGDTPEDEDFVDNFLFEKREGYCVHFATSMTIMARIAGIPARYAEGYKVPKEKDSKGTVYVKNEDAHAWTEVLTDGKNEVWTIYDATGTPRDHENEKNSRNKDNDKNTQTTKPQTKPDTQPKQQTKPQPKSVQQEIKKEEDIKNSSLSKLFVILPLLFLVILLAMIIRKMIMKRILIKDRNGELLSYMASFAPLLGYKTADTLQNITWAEFLARIREEEEEARNEYAENENAHYYQAESSPQDENEEPLSEIMNSDKESQSDEKNYENSKSEYYGESYGDILSPLVDDWYVSTYGEGEKKMKYEDRKAALKSLMDLTGKMKGRFYAFIREYLL